MKQVLFPVARAAMSLVLLTGTAGCSFIFVKTPPSDGRVTSRLRSEECTSSKLAPILDTAFGAYQVVRTGFAVGAADSVYENPDAPLSRGADIALGASFTALFVGSAIYGYVNTSRCGRQRAPDDDPLNAPEPAETWGPSTPEASPAAPRPPAVETASEPAPVETDAAPVPLEPAVPSASTPPSAGSADQPAVAEPPPASHPVPAP